MEACHALSSADSFHLGSMYTLLLIAVAGLKGRILESIGTFAWQVASVLRNPDPGMAILSL